MNIMNKCLVTKFKAVVDDPDLPYFGEVRFHLKRVLEVDRLKITGITSPITLTILGDNDIVFQSNNEKTLTITQNDSSNPFIYIKNGVIGEKFYVKLVSKYNMTNWSLTNNGNENANAVSPIFPAGTLIYHTNVQSIGEDNTAIVMPVTDLIASGNVITTIHNGGSCVISGNYEEYLVTIWNNGRKSTDLIFKRTQPNNFPSKPVSLELGNNTSAIVKFTETSITMSFYNKMFPYIEGAEIIATATYDGSTWTYEMV